MVTKQSWIAAILLAVTLHAAALFVMFERMDTQSGAKDKGLQGVEVNLGMQGSLGEKKVVKKAKPKPKPKPKPKVKKKKQKKKKPKPKPVKKIKAKQQTEVVAKLPEIKPVEIVTPKPLPETPVIVEQQSEPIETVQSEPDEGREQVTQYKKTTGVGSDSTTGAKIAAKTQYTGGIVAKINKYKRYPRFSRRRHEEGVVKLKFTINRTGKVTSYQIVSSSGYPRLDKEVLRMLKKAQPFPPFPPEMTVNEITRSLPISFKLN